MGNETLAIFEIVMRLYHQPRKSTAFTMIEVLVSIVIAGIGLSGTISAYVLSARRAEYILCSSAAQKLAMQRLEQAKAAEWNVSFEPTADLLVSSNFPSIYQALPVPQVSANNITGRVDTTIATFSTAPPIRLIRVDCVWKLQSRMYTSSVYTFRAPN
jgi:prepilin-type N-terminal cleavage/methylation domain-containing protein